MIRSLAVIREKSRDWRALVFFFLILALPLQKKTRIFKEFAASLASGFHFPAAMQKSFYFYLSDLALITFSLLVLFKILRAFFSGSSKYLAAFFGVTVISLFLSTTAGCAIHYARLLHFFLIVAFFCALEQGLIVKDLKALFPKICTLFLFLALFECALGMGDYFFGKGISLGLGEKAAHFTFSSLQGKLWLFDKSHVSVITRAHGTFPHPNIFGGFLFVSLLLTQYLFLNHSSPQSQSFRTGSRRDSYRQVSLVYEESPLWRKEFFNEKKKLLAVALFFQIFTLVLTFSRAALLAYFMGSALLFFYSRKSEWKPLAKVIGLSLVFSALFLLPALQDRGGIFNYNATVQSSDQGRVLFHEIAFNMIREHPLFGVGFNHFLVRMQEFAPTVLAGDQFFPVHNIYLLIASEEGIIGLLLFSLFLASILFRVFKSEMTLERATLLAIFVGFLLIGCFDFYLLTGTQHGRLLFFMIAGLLSFSAKRDNVTVKI